MPNWCQTTYKLVGSRSELETLRTMIKELCALSYPSVPNDFGSHWLGCLVTALGKNFQDVSCRGWIESAELEDGVLTINTSTAWGPCNEVFDLIHSKYRTIEYVFFAEESGNALYMTNDREGIFFDERAIVEVDSPQTEWAVEYFTTEWAAYQWIAEKFGYSVNAIQTAKDVENLNMFLQAQSEDYYIEVFTVKVV